MYAISGHFYCKCSTEALKRSNDALKERCEEMEGWQRRSREEREFLSCRFREARSLVQRLAQENQSLQGQLNHSITQTGSPNVDISKETGSQGQDQEQKCTNTEKNVLVDSPEVGSCLWPFICFFFICSLQKVVVLLKCMLLSLFGVPQVLHKAALIDQAEGDTDKHHMPQSLVNYHHHHS